ncbi:ABC transporter permease [Shimia marina]|uniref:Nickel transport system permease protein NikB n=1 Tax=Shimia marina TaxID=321267 RepID=A0A0P1EPD9_9RHOB|nr:ABC transporter permease [Shimia marina]CUH52187.1 Nickel transport system permease protein NikB [Shimia marina]SFE72040.1 peptide/nickel transport system permease protein [Shimia marina]
MSAFLRYITTRFFAAFTTMLLVSFLVFTLMELVPGNCAERFLAYKDTQGLKITAEDILAEEIRMGLDQPYVIRWANWVTDIFLRFDLGESCLWRVDVTQLIGDKLLISLGLSFVALLLTYAISVPVGIISANLRDGWFDSSLRIFSYMGLALPNFLLALCVMLFSTIYFGETMTGLFSDAYRDAPWSFAKFADMMSRAWLPIVILAWSATAIQMQTVRALVSDEKDKLYVTAARARGQSGWGLLWRYPSRHALGPVINSVGYDLNRIFNDLPIVAAVLVLTDAGALLLDALAKSNDQQLAGAIIMALTATIVIFNFVTDIFLALFDPRVRKGFF